MKQNVKQSKKFHGKLDIIVPIFLLFVILTIAINPAKYSAVAFKGLEVWAKVLVPALLPFFILTKLFSSSSFLPHFTMAFSKPIKKLYKTPPISAYIFFMSIITGYPVGAKLVADFYQNGELSKADAVKTLSFSSNSGPMFILGSVAVGMFTNKTMGIILYVSHILGSLLNGLIYRNFKQKDKKNTIVLNYTNNKNQDVNFSESVNSSIASMLLIGGVICFTFVLIEAILSSHVYQLAMLGLAKLGLHTDIITAIFSGIFEITKGCLMISSLPLSINTATLLCGFVIAFGGISTLLQAIVFTKNIIPTKFFILQKITHALCATFVSFVLLLLF